MEDEAIHRDLFKNCGRKWKFIPYQKINNNKVNAEKSAENKCKKVIRLLEQEQMKRERIKELGIKYDFPGYRAIVQAAQAE